VLETVVEGEGDMVILEVEIEVIKWRSQADYARATSEAVVGGAIRRNIERRRMRMVVVEEVCGDMVRRGMG
jgi:hypothetical protein